MIALLVVTSVVNGFEKTLIDAVVKSQGDLIISTREPSLDPSKMIPKIKEQVPGVVAVTGSVLLEAMFTGPNGSFAGLIEGIDSDTYGQVARIQDVLTSGSRLPENRGEIALGKSLAERLGVESGGTVRLVTSAQDDGKNGPQIQDYQVVGIIHLGLHDYDDRVGLVGISDAREAAFGNTETVLANTLRVHLDDPQRAHQVGRDLDLAWGYPYRFKDWTQFNKNLLYAIKLEKAVIAVVLMAIVFVGAFNIISALLMLVFEREKEISMLRVTGAKRRHLFVLFSFVGSFFGVLGTALGWGVSAVLVALL